MKNQKEEKILNKISIEKLKKIAHINIILLIISYLPIFFFKISLEFTDLNCIWITLIYIAGLSSFVTYFIYQYKNKEKNKSKKWLYMYMIMIIISTLFSSNIGNSIIGDTYLQEGLITYLVYLSLFLNCSIIKDKKYIERILITFSLVGMILSFLTILGYYLGIEFCNKNEYYYRPFLSIFYNENHAAYFFMMTYISSILLFYFSEKKQSIIYLAFSIIILHNLILNNTMGCLLSIICCLILLIIYTIIKKKYYIHLVTILTMFLIVCTVNFDTMSGHISFIKTDIDRMETKEASEVNQIGSNRLALWKYGLQVMIENPLFGCGNENLLEEYKRFEMPERVSKPHNEFIQIGAFFGIPALIIYLCFLFSILFPILKNLKTIEPKYATTALICVSYLISSFFGVTCFYTTPFLYIFLGITSSFKQIEKIKKK